MKEGEDFNFVESAEDVFNQVPQTAEDLSEFWSYNAEILGVIIAFVILLACIFFVGMFFFWMVKRFHN